MFRSTFLVFLVGWTIRFLINKPPPGQLGLPEVGDSMLDNFQQSFDILKAGHLDMAYVFIWDAHYFILSLLGGLFTGLLFGAVSDYFGRRRMRRSFLPHTLKEGHVTDGSEAIDPLDDDDDKK